MAGTLTSLGKQSKTTWLAIEESMIAVEFKVSADGALRNGQPVKLNAAGEVLAWAKTDALSLLIGYVYFANLYDQGTPITDDPVIDTAPVGSLVTVFTRGKALIYAMASGDIDCGPATFSSYNTANADDDGNKGYNVYEAAGANTAMAWILDNPSAANEVVRVLILG